MRLKKNEKENSDTSDINNNIHWWKFIGKPNLPFTSMVWAQDVVEWKLYVDGDLKVTETGDRYLGEQPSWEFKDWEVKVLGVVVADGTFPGMGAIYDIIVPVEWPTNPDPEE